MFEGTPSPQDYMLRVAAEEIEFMEQAYLLQRYPHVAAAFQHPLGRLIVQHIQNFCWTVERLGRRVKERLSPQDAPVLTARHEAFQAPSVLSSLSAPAGPRPLVWIDMTNTHRQGFSGGIERVTLNLAKAAFETGLALPVFVEDGELYEYTGRRGGGARLQFTPDIVYVVADSFWQQADEYSAVCDLARDAGAKVVLFIHDVIPLYYPSLNRADFAQNFARAFAHMIERCDACIVSSKYSREKVRAAIKKMRLRVGRPLPLTHFLLGADGHVGIDPRPIRQDVRDLFARANVFLSVGTLEPRKGYAVTLDAFDELWRQGVDCKFVIIGRTGWISKALEQRILNHPALGTALHWMEDASDAELTFAYRHAYCLLQASITEGFGLPIVEANLEGTPVIATDNEIFRELAGNEIEYFRNCDSADLAEKIAAAVAERPRTGRLPALRWDQSLAQMVACISDVLEQRQAA